MSSIQYLKDSHGIVHLLLDAPDASANTMNAAFQQDFIEATEKILGEADLSGIILRSNKQTFFAGGDLDELVKVQANDAPSFFNAVEAMKQNMRKIETLGKPVVVCINGTALGGGWELCLMSHHRIALNDPKLKLGFPEVTLGLLPGAGGVIRMTRMLGLQQALPFLIEGKQFNPQKALGLGLVDQIADKADEMLEKAVNWIQANPESNQPWDQKGYRMPGGTPASPKVAQMLAIAPAMLRQKTKGCYPAPEAIMSVAVEGAQVDVDTAFSIESRYFTQLVTGQISKNIIGTLWHQLNVIKKGIGRPEGVEKATFKKGGILGAGMMGAGIATVCASRGIDVILKDISQENADKGKAYTESVLMKKVKKGRLSEEKKAQTLDRIKATAELADLADCDLIIEAVFEDRQLKAKVTQETESVLDESAIFGSNTSTLPITGLAEASRNAEQFIGLHFFSPAEKMPLVEIICGEQTSPETLAKSYDFVLQIAKTPIIVQDSRGFYTSRVFGTFTTEGIAMVGEGVEAASVENGAALAGFPVGPLAVTDEVSLSLAHKVRIQTIKDLEAVGKTIPDHPAHPVVDALLQLERPGKAAGAGFYEYPEKGKKHLWSGLQEKYAKADQQIPLQDIKDRLLFIQAVEAVRCLDEGVLTEVRDANIGSIFGIGFPPWTGGALQFINQYGLQRFVERADELASQYGQRFSPPDSLRQRAQTNQTYQDSAVKL